LLVSAGALGSSRGPIRSIGIGGVTLTGQVPARLEAADGMVVVVNLGG